MVNNLRVCFSFAVKNIRQKCAFNNTKEKLTVPALVSRAFAFYYTQQCLVAFNVSKRLVQRFGIASVAAAQGCITRFAVPAG